MDIVQQIIDEIKRRIDLYKDAEYVSAHTCGYLDANETLLEYIESLKKKTEEEPVSKDLEEEFEHFLDNEGMPRMYHSAEQLNWGKNIARYFSGWQKSKDYKLFLKQQKKIDEAYRKGIKMGRIDMKQQMMKDEVEEKIVL